MTNYKNILHLFLLLLTIATGTMSPTALNAQTIHGSVYGGGEIANIGGSTSVTINSGSFGADIFGGGMGVLNDDKSVKASADIGGNTTVNINGGEFNVVVNTNDATKEERPYLQRHNIYGGGNIACAVGGGAYLNMAKGMLTNRSDGSSDFLKTGNGMDKVYMKEGKMFFSIFGGGFGKNTSVTGNTYVDFNVVFDGCQNITGIGLSGDMVEHQTLLDVVGGGFNGSVNGNTYVHVGGDAMCRNLYGGGLYATIGGNTFVDVTGGNIDNVYGGGVMGDINGTDGTLVTIGLHESESHTDAAGNTITYAKDNGKITILGNVYGGNDVSGHVKKATIVHKGGTIGQNIYGAGNGDYTAYYEPGLCAYDEGENDNYISINNGVDAPNGTVYKSRPHTDNVSITMGGAAESDKAKVKGQVFVGGNSCTIGQWDAEKAVTNPLAFLGGGQAHVTLNNHVAIGYTNADLTAEGDDVKALYLRDGENVSGLYMGCSGDHLATQTTDHNDRYYHRYYDSTTKKYWPGFPVYNADASLMTRSEGQAVFDAYLNNILLWTDDVQLTIANDATDIWLANFVGGGFRGSVKAQTEGKKFAWTMPAGVTIGNNVVGGAYNTDVVYRIFKTDRGHTYTTDTHGDYQYLTEKGEMRSIEEDADNGAYHHIEYAADGTTITGIARFNYAGGILKHDNNPADITLTLNNKMQGGDVFGGCFASGTVANTTINYYATDANDVYGGGALANVNGNTTVNLYGGSLMNAYGGGLGRKADIPNSITAVEALVKGNATVMLGKADKSSATEVRGSIFGANNVNGTPKGQVLVHVQKTVPQTTGLKTITYDVQAVYGGGNQAAYVPTLNTVSPRVIVENCDNSIEYVYGGGNAAPVPGTDVKIYGGIIGHVFGGGNGQGVGNPGADVGYNGYYSQTNTATPTYGPGTANLVVYGGTIEDVFGGSNTLGYIRKSAAVTLDKLPDDAHCEVCPLIVANVHGGGNEAPMFCNGSITLNCTKGVDVIYGGSDNADIHGNIDLNITSGTYSKVFCGNNKGGNIYGHLNLNIDETGCWPIIIGELYGGGNEAPYSVYGYTNEGPRTKAQFDAMTLDEKTAAGFTDGKAYTDPTVNIVSCTKIGTVFGGGKGQNAIIYGNPIVNVNLAKGHFAGHDVTGFYDINDEGNRVLVEEMTHIPDALGLIGDVYGGGNAAAVYGDTHVTIREGRFSANIFGGGMGALNDDGSVLASADVKGNTTVEIFGGEFSVVKNEGDDKDAKPFVERYNIYGGGNVACKVGTLDNEEHLVANTGATHLMITKGMFSNNSDGTGNFLKSGPGAMDLAYEREGKMYFCAFGGGYGKNTSVLGNSYVDFNVTFAESTDIEDVELEDDMLPWQSLLDVVGGGFNGDVKGNTFVHVGGNAMCRNLYGGGLYASIGGTTTVDVTGGNIDNVYGGGVMGDILGTTGVGDNAYSTLVNIGLHADREIYDGYSYIKNNQKITILGSVYGGNDVSGHVGTATIHHMGGAINQNIYGAGNGNYRGYYTPNTCDFNDGENDNYFDVVHDDGKPENSGRTYRGRPQTDNVKIVFDGYAVDDRAVVLGQVFGGGNSCTIGEWDSTMLTTKYDGNPHEARDDPAYFIGGGKLNIHFKNHVTIGRSRAQIDALEDEETKSECLNDDGVNVTGLYMGCCGKDLVTQTLNPTDYTYHHYYDAQTKKYWQGFAVYKNEAGHYNEPLTRAEGMMAYDAYLNNILVRSDDVSLTFDDGTVYGESASQDIWLANFVGGGFRGSMQALTEDGKFDYTLPSCVTVADAVIGGSFNAHVQYRIYDTTDGHTYKTDGDGNYLYLTDKSGLKGPDDVTAPEEPDYLRELFDDDGNTIGLVRFNYEGGILAENALDSKGHHTGAQVTTRRNVIAPAGEFSAEKAEELKNNINTVSAKALLRLTLANKVEPSLNGDVVSGGNVYGGCFQSGVVNGDSWVNYICGISSTVASQPGFNMTDQASVNKMIERADDYNKNFGLMLFGAGYGRDTEMKGDCFTAVGTGAMLYNAFGGSYKGKCDSRTFMFCDSQSSGIVAGRLYGGSSMGDIGGSSYAYVNSGNISYVYGGNDVCGKIDGHTYVLVHGGTVFGDVYGAGNGNYLYQVDPQVKEIVATWNNELNKYIYRVPVPADMASSVPLTTAQKLTIINNTRPSVSQANIELNGKDPVAAHDDVPAVQAEYLYINGSAYVGGNSSTVTDDSDPVRLKIGKYVVLNNLFLGSNGENLKVFEYVSNLEKLNDMKLDTNDLLQQYMDGAVAVGNLSPDWAEEFSDEDNYHETYIGTLCLGGNAGSVLADKKLTLTIPETVTMFGNFIAGSKDAVFKYRDAEHRGGMTQPMAAGHYDEPKLELHIRNKWKAKKLDFMPANAATHYLVDNLDGDAYAEGCNVYGGCYQSGTMIGSIKMYIESDMLEYKNDLSAFEASADATKLKNSNARNITVANIYGAGYGPESRNYGNVDIILKDNPKNNSHPSINNIYGGGRNGVLCGHANVRINDGLVYGDVVGGCFAANLYGSTNITVGYPKYYICKQSGKYTLQRGDTWNTTLHDKDGNKVLKDEIRYLKGDRVPQNIYDQIVGFCAIGSEDGVVTSLSLTKGTTSDYFTYVDEATLTGEQSLFPSGGWSAVDINILGGVYGGGYSLNNSTAATAGSNTVCKMTGHTSEGDGFNHDRDQALGLDTEHGQTTVDYGGNSSIIVADNTGLTANHIKISKRGVGGIFGDGHLVFCEGFRAADITGYGYGESTVSNPLLLNTFQRFDLLDVNDCCLKLEGAQDFATDQTDATIYSLARVNELRMNSSIDASGALAATTAAKARNYVELGKNVHLLGSLITNDAFSADYHDYQGIHESGSYQEKKQEYITNYTNAGDKNTALATFKQRNLATARNMIGINSGNALRIQNQYYEGSTAKNYYGPVIGVCEVNLLTLQDGEGGGYVYAKNIHSRDIASQVDENALDGLTADAKRRTSSPGQADFLQTSGNFVFPSKGTGSATQYIVDDCFPKHFGTDADKVTPGNGSAAEAHYWYVEGDKYFFNTTLTGYTFKKTGSENVQTFHLTDNDQNVLLSGVDSDKKLRIKSVTWNTSYPTGYKTDLKDISPSYTPTAVSGSTPYAFSIKVGDVWSATMNRSNMDEQAASDYTNGTDVLPIFDVELQDYVNNDGEAYYNEHLAQPEKVIVVMEALDGSDQLVGTYTVNMDVVYVLGPTYDGNVLIKNCALPGERIAFGSDGITVKTSDQMPITSTGWKLCPKGSTPGTWDASSAQAIEIPKSQYDSDFSGGATTGWIHAQRKYNEWNIAYTFTAGGHTFTVWPSQDATKEQEKHLVVHNYYDMADVVNEGALYHIAPQSGARIYIRNKEGWDAFVNYLNAATADNTLGIPAGLAGMKLYLQTDITLDAVPSISVPFAGELNGDGYSITIPTGSLFGSSLAAGAKVYNLGVIGGSSITTVENTTENCFVKDANAEFLYGTKAYELSHNYTTTAQYITDNRYVKGALITAAHDDQPDVYAAGDWQYARQNSQDSRMLRTGVTPNYGSTVTAHNMEHTAAEITEHDCLFFGQTLNPDGIVATPYPQHIDDTKNNGEWVEANRVYQAEGYYRSKTDDKFHYNKAAWALQPTLTAVNFVGASDAPTSFGNSDADDEHAEPGMQHVTKNLLVYAPATPAIAKAADSENYFLVTKSGEPATYTCADLALVDKEDFNAPIAFTATKASYVRKPGEETGYVEAPGKAWESICLPFSPTKATLSEGILIYPYDDAGAWTKNGERTLKKDITFFYGESEDYESGNHIRHEYWLRELQSVGGTDGHQMVANFARPGFGIDDDEHRGFKAYTPYIVSFPGSRFYEFDMTGQTVTFSAAAAAVGVTDDATATLNKTVNGVTYTGAFLNESATTGKYAIKLKVDKDEANGAKFEEGKAVYPFRAYMTGSVSAAKIMSRAIYIGGALENTPENFDDESHGDPGNGEVVPAQTMKAYAIRHSIVIDSNYEDDVLIYTSSGQLARAVRVLEGENLYTGFASGVYVINGKKIIVR